MNAWAGAEVEGVHMGLFDQIGGALKGALASELAANGPALLNAALAKTNMGNLQGLGSKPNKIVAG
jgi:hypothetical protein